MDKLLDVKNLGVSFYGEYGETKAVKNVSFSVGNGEVFGIVGESGSGKSVSTKSILQLMPQNGKITSGEAWFEGKNILDMKGEELRKFRGHDISIIFQDSLSALNPVYTIGAKLVELIRRNEKMSKKEAYDKAVGRLKAVGISDPEKNMKSFPHELSGGMRQRVMIAMAISSNPKIMIADEPTTALDVTIQSQILHLLKEIQKNTGMSIVLITHDLGVVAQTCQRVAVMCGGYIVEQGSVNDIFLEPKHPYTQALIASMPKVGGEKMVQFLERNVDDDAGNLCPFVNRCKYAKERCSACIPEMYSVKEGHEVLCHRKENINEQ